MLVAKTHCCCGLDSDSWWARCFKKDLVFSLLSKSCCRALVGAVLSIQGCDPAGSAAGDPDQDAVESGVPAEESPNARILPDPLAEVPGAVAEDPDDASGGLSSSPTLSPRPTPEPWPLFESLRPGRAFAAQQAAGYRLVARMVWPEAAPQIKEGEKVHPSWPQFAIEVVRESSKLPAHFRWEILGGAFPLPPGSQWRGRSDRVGALLVWPDQRSYRVVSPQAVRAVLTDRRADHLPFVETSVEPAGEGMRLNRKTQRFKLQNSIGELHLELTEIADLPYGAQMICAHVLQWFRVRADEDRCALGMMPVRAFSQWPGDGKFLFEVTELRPAQELLLENFRTPPPLPIFKRGELPPFEGELLGERNARLLPLKAPGEPVAPDPAPQVENPSDPAQVPSQPSDQILVENGSDRPLFLFVEEVPHSWIAAGQVKELRASSVVRLAARDFFGTISLDEGPISAPRTVTLAPSPIAPPNGVSSGRTGP